MQTRLSVFCSRVIEAGWLLLLVTIPPFFNFHSDRIFEADKVALLRSIVLIMIGAWVISIIDARGRQHAPGIQAEREKLPSDLWRWVADTPLVLPVLLFTASYTLSSLLSVMPRMSLLGSYQRLQGTYTMLSYIAVFFLLVVTLRTKEQVNWLCNVITVTSLPIALHGILQHYRLDPIPWGGDVFTRVTGSMGNPIFLSAYLIMVVPITFARLIEVFPHLLKKEERNTPSLLTALGYIIILIAQLICILFTKSRGPWLGLLGALYIFILIGLIALRNSTADRSRLKAGKVLNAFLFCLLSIPVGVVPAYAAFIVRRRGFRWLWLSWIFHTLIGAAFLILLNLPNTPLSSLRELPYIGRLGQLSETESGTGKVRVLIWRGTLDLLKADPLRFVIGYGPETMQLVYGPYYPPDLAHHEARSVSPDRSHNEIFDILVNTGVIGLAMYLFLVGSIFWYGMKCLGFMEIKRMRILYFTFIVSGTVAGIFLPKLVEGTYTFSGAGLTLGFTGSVCLFLILYSIFSPEKGHVPVWSGRQVLILGLLSAVTAHLIEIQFGIAITTPRLLFWVYAGVLVLVGSHRLNEDIVHQTGVSLEEPGRESHQRTKKKGKQTLSPAAEKSGRSGYLPQAGVLSGSFLMAALLFTLGWTFTVNPLLEENSLKMVQRLFTIPGLSGNEEISYSTLWIFFAPWVLGAFIVFYGTGRRDPSSRRKHLGRFPIGLYTAITLLVLVACMVIHTHLLEPQRDITSVIAFYYSAILVLMALIALFLYLDRPILPKLSWRGGYVWAYPILLGLIMVAIYSSNVKVVKADMYYKMGKNLREKQFWDASIQFYRRAIALEPEHELYYQELSRSLLDKAGTLKDRESRIALYKEISGALDRAQKLNPLNPDPYINLGTIYHKWADLASGPEERAEKLRLAHSYYGKAVERNPNNAKIWDQWAMVYLSEHNNKGALEKLTHSLSLDREFSFTYIILGDLYREEGRLQEAAGAYRQAITCEPTNARAWSALGYLYYQQGNVTDALNADLEATRIDPQLADAHSLLGVIYTQRGQVQEAIAENLRVIEIRPHDAITYRNLALLYNQVKQTEQSLIYAREALALLPESERPALQDFIRQLTVQKNAAGLK